MQMGDGEDDMEPSDDKKATPAPTDDGEPDDSPTPEPVPTKPVYASLTVPARGMAKTNESLKILGAGQPYKNNN